jgi:hypothetical protein
MDNVIAGKLINQQFSSLKYEEEGEGGNFHKDESINVCY